MLKRRKKAKTTTAAKKKKTFDPSIDSPTDVFLAVFYVGAPFECLYDLMEREEDK